MSENSVRIIELPPMRVASALGFGEAPEGAAWEKLFGFLHKKDLWDEMESLSYYGFNNPDPTPASPNYGYEQWVTVPEKVDGDQEITIKMFGGGLYAVSRCVGIPNIFSAWRSLFAWREDSPYLPGTHQWLEKWVNPVKGEQSEKEMIMDLYIPIIKSTLQ